jgi:phospholipase C
LALSGHSKRSFKGTLKAKSIAAFDVQVAYDPKGGSLRTQIRNAGGTPVKRRIAANAYRNVRPWRFSLAPYATAERSWKISANGNWYDFTVSAAGFEQRFAGRMENGGNLISDPLMET